MRADVHHVRPRSVALHGDALADLGPGLRDEEVGAAAALPAWFETSKGLPSFPSYITRNCTHSLLTLKGIARIPF